MHIAASILAALAAGSLTSPISSPTTQLEKRSFRVPVDHVFDNTPRALPDGLQRRGDGRAGVTQNFYWFAKVTVGGNQTISLALDTGSSVTWSLSPNSSAQQNAGQAIYDPSLSPSSSRIAGETFDIAYSDGSYGVNGTVYTDNLCVGTACSANAPIGLANVIKGFMPGSLRSGIMGLSFGAAGRYVPRKLPTFMEALQGSLTLPVWTANFRTDGTGYADFGNVDASLFDGALQTVQIDNSTGGGWLARNVGFYANGTKLGNNATVSFDTGSGFSFVPNDTYVNYHSSIPGASIVNGYWAYPCANKGLLPAFEFRFPGGAVGRIPGPNMNYVSLDGGKNCVSWVFKGGSVGSVGLAFFNASVVVFNQSVPAISLAAKKNL